MAARTVGFEALQRKIARLPVEARKQMADALDKDGDELVAAQKVLAEAHAKSGNTVKSIRKEKGATELEIFVKAGGELTTKEVRSGSGVPYDYVRAQEFGTKAHTIGGLFKGAHHPGETKIPFFWPAYRLLKKRLKSRISRAVNKAAKTAWEG